MTDLVTSIELEQLLEADNLTLKPSSWIRIDQERIDGFAQVTDDQQWIHCDLERAASGPFGATVAHGYLTISLIPRMLSEVLEIVGKGSGVNYGFEKVRFVSPVPSGSDIRLRAKVLRATRKAGGVCYWIGVEIDIRGADKPAVVGELVALALP